MKKVLIVDDSITIANAIRRFLEEAGYQVDTINDSTINGYAMVSGLNDGVLLCMNTTAQFMHLAGFDTDLFPHTTDFETMFQTPGCAVVTC